MINLKTRVRGIKRNISEGKGSAINELVVCNNWDLEPLDLLNGLALDYQPSPEA